MIEMRKKIVSWRPIKPPSSPCSPRSQTSISSISDITANCFKSELENIVGKNPILSSLVPRPTAWMAVYPAQSNKSNNYNESQTSSQNEALVCLIEGYCGASDRPPTLMVGSDSISPKVLAGLRDNGFCTLSVATVRENKVNLQTGSIGSAKSMAAVEGHNCGPSKTFFDAGLEEEFPSEPLLSTLNSLPLPSRKRCNGNSHNEDTNDNLRPPSVRSSPVQMHCRLVMEVPLEPIPHSTTDFAATESQEPSMMLLQIDSYVINGSILRKQSTLHEGAKSIQGNPDVRAITAKIDFLLLRPLASVGGGKFGVMNTIYHMGRPRPLMLHGKDDLNGDTCDHVDWEDGSHWEIDDLVLADSRDGKSTLSEEWGNSITYTYRKDAYCSLGYNPMKQVVCPRFIGWISTYEPNSLKGNNDPIAHISPYSFFMDVARGSRPMVAFAACPRSDEFEDSDNEVNGDDSKPNSFDAKNESALPNKVLLGSSHWKDAQRDAELTGVFCVNLVSQELAWAMNASAAPLGKGLSEFRLMNTSMESSDSDPEKSSKTIPVHVRAPSINAPMVMQSPLIMECLYVKTVKIPDIFEGDSMYSLIIGEVINIHVRREFLKADGIDLEKMSPVARLGYGQEYTVVCKCE
ncbi:hypothetical protein ACHAXS_001772 [Conticribra weissflogii]